MQTIPTTSLLIYQQAAYRTCLPTSQNLAYMTLGLISEAGEVAGKIAKLIRDDNTSLADHQAAIIAELGDVLWMLVGLYSVKSEKFPFDDFSAIVPETVFEVSIARGANYDHLAYLINNTALWVVDYHYATQTTDHAPSTEHVRELLVYIDILARKCGVSLQEVCQRNINKLTARYNANTIHGNGDNR